MKSRFLIMLIPALSVATTAFGQSPDEPRRIFLELGAPPIQSAFTLEIGIAPVGSQVIVPVMSADAVPGDLMIDVRNKLVPTGGIPGVAKRVSQNQIRVFHSDTIQYWYRVDAGPWDLLEPYVSQFVPSPNWEIRITEYGTNGIASVGNVPAVSAYGLVALALAVLVGGSLVIRKRAAVR